MKMGSYVFSKTDFVLEVVLRIIMHNLPYLKTYSYFPFTFSLFSRRVGAT